MYNVDMLLGLEVYFWHRSKMPQHLSNIRITVQQFNCEFLPPTIKKITHNILSTVTGGKGREINMGEMTQNLQFSS